MAKIITSSEIGRNERDAKIVALAMQKRDDFSSRMDLYLYIAQRVKCSHITVYRVLRRAAI